MNRNSLVDSELRIPTTVAYHSSRAKVMNLLRLASVLFLSLIVGLLFLFSEGNLTLPILVTAVIILIPLLWKKPALGLYILLAAAITIELFSLQFPDSFTDQIPFFRGVGSSGILAGVDLNPAELLMILVLAIWLLKGIFNRNLRFEKGPIFVPFTAYIVMVSIGALYGITTGGDAVTALWEIRAQFYAYICYILAFNLLKNQGQAKIIMWICIIGIGFKGLIGTWRYLVTLQGDASLVTTLTDYNSILSHEESYFFALFITFILILFLFRSARMQKQASLLLLVPVLIAFLANQRRIGMIVLAVSIALVLLFALIMLKDRRSLIFKIAIPICLVLPLYFAAFWSSTGSLLAQPVQTIRSVVDPFDRDYASNTYREAESYNISYNIRQDPIVGTGYGKMMATPAQMTDISDIYVWWNIIPHDNILWVWWRIGSIGFIIFWILMASTMIRGCLMARRLNDRWLKGVATFIITAIIGLLLVSSADMGLVNFRLMTYCGILMGLMFQLPNMDRNSEQPVDIKASTVPERLKNERKDS